MKRRMGLTLGLSGLLLALGGSSNYAAETEELVADESVESSVKASPSPEATLVASPTPLSNETPVPDKDLTVSKPGEEDGVVIISPGSSSPEESLEAFGIDSPFNWRSNAKKQVGEPDSQSESEESSIQVNAPETSDLGERVALESNRATGLGEYEEVERAGSLLGEGEDRFEGRVSREKNGRFVAQEGGLVYLEMEPGRQAYPGTLYAVYRVSGRVMAGIEKRDMGIAARVVAVIKVVRVDSESVLARIEKAYSEVFLGDRIRPRDADRAKHFATLRQGQAESGASDIKAHVVALRDLHRVARMGEFVYIDAGRLKGVYPGLRLSVQRFNEHEADAYRSPGSIGKVADLLVISSQRNSATARVLKAPFAVKVGDRAGYR